MAKRTKVNCEICKSFLHSTKEHKGLGISVEELNRVIKQAYDCGYDAAKFFYEPQLQSKKETKLKEKLLKKFLKKVGKK